MIKPKCDITVTSKLYKISKQSAAQAASLRTNIMNSVQHSSDVKLLLVWVKGKLALLLQTKQKAVRDDLLQRGKVTGELTTGAGSALVLYQFTSPLELMPHS